MLYIQKYLQSYTYQDLEAFGIQVGEYEDRIVLNYHQIDSKHHKFNPMVMECRGLILSKPDHRVLCRSFDRFWNYGEDPKSDEFDITKATVDTKIDGSLISVYHDGDKWQCSTRRMAFAEGPIPNKKMTFRDVFISAIGGDPDDVFKEIHTDLVIIFELVSPETRVVTPYPEREVYLLDVRARDNGTFYGRDITYNWPMPDNVKWRYPVVYDEFESWKGIIRASEDLPALEEGYIARIGDWRIKIKNPAYLAIAHLRENGAITEKRVVKLVDMQDHEEYLLHFPEDRPEFEPYITAYEYMMENIKVTYEYTHATEDQKEFALAIQDCPGKGVLFKIRKGDERSIRDIIDGFTDNYKLKLLKGYLKWELDTKK